VGCIGVSHVGQFKCLSVCRTIQVLQTETSNINIVIITGKLIQIKDKTNKLTS